MLLFPDDNYIVGKTYMTRVEGEKYMDIICFA